jgi:hypothetical protein
METGFSDDLQWMQLAPPMDALCLRLAMGASPISNGVVADYSGDGCKISQPSATTMQNLLELQRLMMTIRLMFTGN